MAAHSHAAETKRPLSKSLRRSATSLNRNRAHDPISTSNSNPNPRSLLNQALLRASRDQQQSPDLHKPPIDPKSSPFSLHTTPPPTPESKHLTRSHTFSSSSPFDHNSSSSSSLRSKNPQDRPPKLPVLELLPPPPISSSSSSSPLLPPNPLNPNPPNPISSSSDGSSSAHIVVKSLFRSSTFSASHHDHDVKVVSHQKSFSSQSQQQADDDKDDPAHFGGLQPKSFLQRSSTFVHKVEQHHHQEQASGAGKTFARSVSNISSSWIQEESNSSSSSSSSSSSKPSSSSDPMAGLSRWARGFRTSSRPTTTAATDQMKEIPIPESSPYSLLSGAFAKRPSPSRVLPVVEIENTLGVFTKGFFDSSRNAVKAVQNKARHLVLHNKQRYQEGGHPDVVYITENVIAMGFPPSDLSSGLLGFVEGYNRAHMEEVITFLETQHLGKYKVYNLCSEKLYDMSLLEGKVASFPIDDNNCPPLQLVSAFCESAYTWLKAGLENVVVVHCKAGMARTGLMISCLLLFLKFFPTAEESINYYNQKRCVDSKGLSLPSQLRYVKYFERVLRENYGFTPTGRRCLLRRINLINCPTWVRPALTISDHKGVLFLSKKHPQTKSMPAENLWQCALRSDTVVFELPDSYPIASVDGDFKIHFQDRHGNFSCWLNTNMMRPRDILLADELDGFHKRRLVESGFQVEVELLDDKSPVITKGPTSDFRTTGSGNNNKPLHEAARSSTSGTDTVAEESDNIFTDSEGEEEELDLQDCARPSISGRDLTQQQQQQQHATSKREELAGRPDFQQSTFHVALSNAMSEMSSGFLNAMDRFGISHLGGQNGKSMSMPSSPRISRDRLGQFGSARSADYERDGWSTTTGSSRFQNDVAKGMEKDSEDFEKDEFAAGPMTADYDAIRTNSHVSGEQDESHRPIELASGASIGSENPANSSFRSEEPGGSFRSEDEYGSVVLAADPPSDFQALAAASAADASLFTFGDDEDYESDEEL